MTSMGDMSAAMIMTALGSLDAEVLAGGDFRRAFTTSLTPRLSVLFLAAGSKS